jgi:hypothetical protein
MSKLVLDGPPWDQYVDDDEAYVRGQAGALGSGALGGWSQANLGGYFVDAPSNELRQDVRQLVRKGPAVPGNGAEARGNGG